MLTVTLPFVSFSALDTGRAGETLPDPFFHSSGPLVRTAPMVIASDIDLAAAASSGSGTAGDPYVIQDILIECNDTGVGITVSGTSAHAIFRNIFINESGAGPADLGFLIQASQNIDITNTTIEFAGNGALGIIASGHLKVDNSTLYFSGGPNLYFEGSWDLEFENLTLVSDETSVGSSAVMALNLMTGNGSTSILFDNCTIGHVSTFAYIQDLTISNSNLNKTNFPASTSSINITDSSCSGGIGLWETSDVSIHNCRFENEGIGANMLSTAVTNLDVIDCVFNATSTAIYLDNDVDINVQNCTAANNTGLIVATDTTSIRVRNCTITDTLSPILIQGAGADVLIAGNYINNCSTGIYIDQDSNITLSYNTIHNCADMAIRLHGGSGYRIIGNDIRYVVSLDSITIESGATIGTIQGNYFYLPGNLTHNADAAIWFDVLAGANVLITQNTFDTVNDTTNGNALMLYDGSNMTISNNTFIRCRSAIAGTATITVRYNTFIDNIAILEGSHTLTLTMDHNYYADYFDEWPNAVLTNSSTSVLQYPYPVTGAIDDPYPMYRASLYPRSDAIDISVHRLAVYNQILPSSVFRFYLDGSHVSNSTNVNAVLFTLAVYDLFSSMVYYRILNVNATGQDLDITVNAHKLRVENELDHSVRATIRKNTISQVLMVDANSTEDIWLAYGSYSVSIKDLDSSETIYSDTVSMDESKKIVLSASEPDEPGQEDNPPTDNNIQMPVIVILAIGCALAGWFYLSQAKWKPGKYGGKRK